MGLAGPAAGVALQGDPRAVVPALLESAGFLPPSAEG